MTDTGKPAVVAPFVCFIEQVLLIALAPKAHPVPGEPAVPNVAASLTNWTPWAPESLDKTLPDIKGNRSVHSVAAVIGIAPLGLVVALYN